jgi:nitroreductase
MSSHTPAHTIAHNDLLTSLRWRYATKQFDATRKIPADTWASLEEALVLTPSSYGLQPWTFVVVSDPELRARLRGLSWNQAQITDSSHLVVFAARRSVDEAYIGRFLDRTAEVRGVARESLDGFGKRIAGDLVKGPRAADISSWAARQAFISLGNFLTAAALLGVDTCALEGIDPDGYDEALGLSSLGLRTVVAATAGYRLAEDKYGALPKVRFRPEEVILRR